MNKILVIGDTHMGTSFICNVAIPQARKNDCKLIVQVGDFGFWEPEEHARKFLNKVSKCLVREGMTMIWLDGNHERHKVLWENYPAREDGLSEIRQNLFYAPRGHVMKIGPVTCLFMGGAYSIDKHGRLADELAEGRVEGYYWSPDEMITTTDVERAIRHIARSGPIDLMFTHDVPTGIDVPGVHSTNKDFFPESTRNRMMLRLVFDRAQPKMLVHGHYHERYTGKLPLKPQVDPESDVLDWGYCRVDGLSYNGEEGFAIVLDMESIFVKEKRSSASDVTD